MKYDLIIIGGGPAGIITGVNTRKYYPDKSILVVKDIENGVIPCAIPYMIYTLNKCEDNILGNASLEKNNIELRIGNIDKINKEEKNIELNKEKIEYDKLVLAMGSSPLIPPVEGKDKKGVYTVVKDLDYLKELKEKVKNSTNIVLIGGGFIGVEFADEITKLKDKNITIIEMLPRILSTFDKEFSEMVHKKLEEKGVNILTNNKVTAFLGQENISGVKTEDKEINADIIILGAGARPNYEIAEEAGLSMEGKSIKVNEFQKTSDENIFAVGDCAYKKDFITRKQSRALLASSATKEARIAGKNIFNEKVNNKGTIEIYSTKIDNISLGAAGLTEEQAKNENINYVKGEAEVPDKHPGKMPGACITKTKLLFSKENHNIIGGQIYGGDSVGEMINIVGALIQKQATMEEIEELEIGTHPKLTPAPTQYPIIIAAQNALSKM